MGRRNHLHIFLSLAVDCDKQTPKGLLHSEALIAKIYFTKILSSVQVLDSLPPPGKMPTTKFLSPYKTTIFML